MPFNFYDAIAASLWATTAMTAFWTLCLALGLSHLDFARLLGGIVTPHGAPYGRNSAVAGFVINLTVGIAFGLIYAGLFAYLGLVPQLWLGFFLGAGFGLYHWIISMPLVSAGRLLNPHVRKGEEPDPGIWGIRFGPQEALFRLVGHVLFGAVFGFSYVAVGRLNGTFAGTAVAGNGLAMLLPLMLLAAVVFLYVTAIPMEAIEREGAVFAATELSMHDRRLQERLALKERYERGEITWDEYQHERRQYGAQP